MIYDAWGDDGAGDYDHLLDAGWWPSEQAEEMVGAINALFAEPIYEDGEKANGISVRFLMRMQMLKDAACMAEPNDPFVAEARAYFAAQAEPTSMTTPARSFGGGESK